MIPHNVLKRASAMLTRGSRLEGGRLYWCSTFKEQEAHLSESIITTCPTLTDRQTAEMPRLQCESVSQSMTSVVGRKEGARRSRSSFVHVKACDGTYTMLPTPLKKDTAEASDTPHTLLLTGRNLRVWVPNTSIVVYVLPQSHSTQNSSSLEIQKLGAQAWVGGHILVH
jgi:hypothetical protein